MSTYFECGMYALYAVCAPLNFADSNCCFLDSAAYESTDVSRLKR